MPTPTVKLLIFAVFGSFFLISCSLNDVPKRSDYTLKTDGQVPASQQGLVLTHVDLSIEVLPKQKHILGEAMLHLNTAEPRREVGINLDNLLKVNQVTLNGQILSQNAFENIEGLLLLSLSAPVSGDFEVGVQYAGVPRIAVNAPWDGGFTWAKTASGQDWIATTVQGEGCDLFWPCIDYPSGEPKTVKLHVTVPDDLYVASNGILKNISEKAGKKTFHWETLSQHNTYGIALNIAPYQIIQETYQSIYGNTVPIVYYHLPESADDAVKLVNEMHQMLAFFERTIGPYPFADEKMGVAETPHLGMEHQTINAYGNKYRLDEFGFDWLLLHEFAHEWFANQLTNTNADHMWLHEGYATYMHPFYAQYLHGEAAYMTYLYRQRTQIVNAFPIVSNNTITVQHAYEEETGPSSDIYYKGSWILHTLRALIGDDAFFTATRALVYGVTSPQLGNFKPLLADTDDLIRLVNKETGKDFQWFFDVYLYQAALPELQLTRDNSTLSLHWKIDNNKPFPMPVEISINGEVRTVVPNDLTTIQVSPSDIVIVDPASKLLKRESHIEAYQAYKKAGGE